MKFVSVPCLLSAVVDLLNGIEKVPVQIAPVRRAERLLTDLAQSAGRIVEKVDEGVFLAQPATQFKNRNRRPVTLDLPILPELQAAIDTAPSGNLTFLVSAHGQPFTSAGFGNRMRKWCDAAGLKECTAHGLRKAGACIAAENGATEAQLMAIFGWSDPDIAALYTKKERQKRIAGDAMGLLVRKVREER